LKHLSAFTDNLQTFLELSDEAHMQAQVLTLDFGTTSTIVCEDAPSRTLPSREDFPRQRSPWSYDEEQALRSALLLGFDVEWIGQRLNRTGKAVQRKIDRMRTEGTL
jgi:hypothetical protein